MAKKVLFAHTKEIVQFDSKEEAKSYFKKQIFSYKLLKKEEKDGKIIITFIKAYNKATMLDETKGFVPPSLEELKQDYEDLVKLIKNIRTVEQAKAFQKEHNIPVEINGNDCEDFEFEYREEIEWIRYDHFGHLSYIYDYFDGNPEFDIYYGPYNEDLLVENVHFEDLTEDNYFDWFFKACDKNCGSDDYSFETGV